MSLELEKTNENFNISGNYNKITTRIYNDIDDTINFTVSTFKDQATKEAEKLPIPGLEKGYVVKKTDLPEFTETKDSRDFLYPWLKAKDEWKEATNILENGQTI